MDFVETRTLCLRTEMIQAPKAIHKFRQIVEKWFSQKKTSHTHTHGNVFF